jgi:hypothetical protein
MFTIFIEEEVLTDDSILDVGDDCTNGFRVAIVEVKLFDSESDT